MTEASKQAEKYLEECASACPMCESVNARWDQRSIRRDPVNDGRPIVKIEWMCRECGHRWMETFRLESVCWAETRTVVVGASRS